MTEESCKCGTGYGLLGRAHLVNPTEPKIFFMPAGYIFFKPGWHIFMPARISLTARVIFSDSTCPCRPLFLLFNLGGYFLADIGYFFFATCSGRGTHLCRQPSLCFGLTTAFLIRRLTSTGMAPNLLTIFYSAADMCYSASQYRDRKSTRLNSSHPV